MSLKELIKLTGVVFAISGLIALPFVPFYIGISSSVFGFILYNLGGGGTKSD